MAARPHDQIWIEGERGRYAAFSRIEVSHDIFGEAQCVFCVADDRAWRSLRELFYPGREYRVMCNGLPVFVGRVECHELPVTAEDGTTIQVVMRSRLADSRIGAANSKVEVSGVSIRKLILDLYRQHGFTEQDFLFTVPDVERDLITGRANGLRPPANLDLIQILAAKIKPTETTDQAARRHLERHHLMMWEGGSGLICVGLPNDQQAPLYRFFQRPGACNLREARPVRDWTDVPTELYVYGGVLGFQLLSSPVRGLAVDLDLAAGGFNRKVVLNVEGARTVERAQSQAKREMHARSRRKAAWELRVDDWTFWDGARATPYAVNTTCDVDVQMHEGTDLRGVFLVTAVRKTLDVDAGASTSLTLLAQGLIDPIDTVRFYQPQFPW